MGVRLVAWKEVKDLARDWRTIAATILMPMAGLPLLALLTGVLAGMETVNVVVAYEDDEAAAIAGWIADSMKGLLSEWGVGANVSVARGAPPTPAGVDVLVVLPRGFAENLTSVDRVAYVRVSVLVGSPASDAARRAAETVVGWLSSWAAEERVKRLSELAGVTVDPRAVLDPVRVYTGYHLPGGAPAGREEVEVAATARLLELALFFVANPAVVYMSDAIVGERERRTLESLLATPLDRRSLLAGKVAAASLLGVAAALADTAGVLIYFHMASGAGLQVTPGLVALHAVVSALLVVMTASIIAPVAARSGSVRSAQASSFLVLMAAMAVYFTAFAVDLLRLPQDVQLALMLVPFTHAALAIHYYILGLTARAALHIAVMAAVTALSLAAAARAFNSEKLILSTR